jgi:hypothetical protein
VLTFFAFEEALLVRVAWNAAVGELGIGTLNTTLVAKQSNLV